MLALPAQHVVVRRRELDPRMYTGSVKRHLLTLAPRMLLLGIVLSAVRERVLYCGPGSPLIAGSHVPGCGRAQD
jgi:hypothetical protein